MSRRTIRLGTERPLLDITSYGRGGPGRRDRLKAAELDHIRRTASRAPEVMVKVLTRGNQSVTAIRRHFDYLARRGQLALEVDGETAMRGTAAGKALVEDWELAVEALRDRPGLQAGAPGRALKLVHKVIFSMPPGTPPDKVLAAVRNLAREEFALKHRYAMVLHTDEPHPHVHVVVKAVSEQGERLNIRKDTLRHWRAEFARHLRELGVEANATERAVRGASRTRKLDGIYRAHQRGESWHMRDREEAIVRGERWYRSEGTSAKTKVLETYSAVRQGWETTVDLLLREGQTELASLVSRFVERMPVARTEQELLAAQMSARRHAPRVR